MLKDRNILENRSCTEIITLIRLLRDKNYDETVENLIRKDSIIKNYSCDDQIKLIDKILDIEEYYDEEVSNVVIEDIICSSKVPKKFNVDQIIELIDKYLQKRNRNVLSIITNEDVIKHRNLQEIMLLIDIYNLYPTNQTKFLIKSNSHLSNLSIKQQIKVIEIYNQNCDLNELWTTVYCFDFVHFTTEEYFKEINDEIHRLRNTYYAKEAITKFDNINDFIKCLEADDVKEINSNTKIYCYIPKEDKK